MGARIGPGCSVHQLTRSPSQLGIILLDHAGGKAMVVGYDAKERDVLIVAIGAQFTELDAAICWPTGRTKQTLDVAARMPASVPLVLRL